MTTTKISIHWFRRDLRLSDNAALYHALKNSDNVLPIFIFDTEILNKLEDKNDARVTFIRHELNAINVQLSQMGSSLLCFYGYVLDTFKELIAQYNITNVYTNHDYEPSAIQRDQEVKEFLNEHGIIFKTFKDQVIFETNEVLKDDGKPYAVFTPYSRKWKAKLNPFYYKEYPTEKYFKHFFKTELLPIPSLESMGFIETKKNFPGRVINQSLVQQYKEQRDFPAINGTSLLSVHLRFGTISCRKLVAQALLLNETWLNELIWREFYMMILYHFPRVVNGAFKPQYNHIKWTNDEVNFKRWCDGQTGYPIVDAGMRQLNETGFMHNRVRMITASFLVKHLLINWQWGEAYFAKKLLDFELSSNNGGWQWSASSGCDAAPYFRIFNPYEQTKKFDPQLKYIKKWVPEFEDFNYPAPIVDHKFARERVLKTYKEALSES
jgi:deoxyribodipyrimidine photo-lyase